MGKLVTVFCFLNQGTTSAVETACKKTHMTYITEEQSNCWAIKIKPSHKNAISTALAYMWPLTAAMQQQPNQSLMHLPLHPYVPSLQHQVLVWMSPSWRD